MGGRCVCPLPDRMCKGLRVLRGRCATFVMRDFSLERYISFFSGVIPKRYFFYTTLINGKSFVSFALVN